ncbi:hypothetical protein BP6252_04441 [Coleophoma cylindrospora]|uniref:Rhodopsin domain-containing protein n=1 Tax=Coleophoma cylindrospora TaxID=1849047 RepID=A0A3D8S0H4_9HELO|nr:hypothetical protein BP6252_04441 [Coleophoma cylindrospora]
MYSLQQELWIEYGIGTLVFLLRFFARIKVVGFRGLQWDDFFALVALTIWTIDAVIVELIGQNGSFVGLDDASAAALTDAEVAKLEFGSKVLFCGWISYTSMIWSMKAVLLCFYHRLTLGLWQQEFIRVMKYVLILAYIATILTLFLHCTPIQKNWQIKPYVGDKCAVTVLNYIMIAVMNVTTDLCLLAIPIPLLWTVRLPVARKLLIGVLLCSGFFVVTAALLRCILSLLDIRHINNSTIWAIRETFVSVVATSAPAIKPLFNKDRWLGSTISKSGSKHKFLKFGDEGGSGGSGGTVASKITVTSNPNIRDNVHPGTAWAPSQPGVRGADQTELLPLTSPKIDERSYNPRTPPPIPRPADEENQHAAVDAIQVTRVFTTDGRFQSSDYNTPPITVSRDASVSSRPYRPSSAPGRGSIYSWTQNRPGNFTEISAGSGVGENGNGKMKASKAKSHDNEG